MSVQTPSSHAVFDGPATVGFANCGHRGTPGTQASQITCLIEITEQGRWHAYGRCSYGQNQGYYEENYRHGPYEGRGDSVAEALDRMLERADNPYREELRKAIFDARLDAEDRFGPRWEKISWVEAMLAEHRRLLLETPESTESLPLGVLSDKDGTWRQAEIARLETILARRQQRPHSPLTDASDEELLEEARYRRLI